MLCLSLGLGVAPLAAQVQTGLYPYGSFDNVGFDSIDRGSLNVHFSIPVVSKPGRGLGFSYQLVYDGLVWSPVPIAGRDLIKAPIEIPLHQHLAALPDVVGGPDRVGIGGIDERWSERISRVA